MEAPLHFRAASSADLSLLGRMNARLIQDEGHSNPMDLAGLEERMRRWIETEYRAVVFEQRGEAVGYALYTMGEQYGQRFIFLRQFYVEREFRRRSVGRRAMRLLIDQVWPPGIRVVLDVLFRNDAGRAFWKAMGFVEQSITLERRGTLGDGSGNEKGL